MGSLKDIVDEIVLESTAIDSLFRNKEVFMMFKYGKEGMKKLNLTFAQGVKGMSVRIPASCKVYMPSDYQSFIRAYILGCDGNKIEIARNMNVPKDLWHYLINCDGSILTDENGDDLYDDCIQCDNIPSMDCSMCCGTGKYVSCDLQGLYSDMNAYKDAWVKNHDDDRMLEFSTDLEETAMVIEYFSNNYNNMTECQINVPAEYEECLDYYIRFKLLEHSEGTKQEAMYYRNMFKNIRDKIIVEQNPLTIETLNAFIKNK